MYRRPTSAPTDKRADTDALRVPKFTKGSYDHVDESVESETRLQSQCNGPITSEDCKDRISSSTVVLIGRSSGRFKVPYPSPLQWPALQPSFSLPRESMLVSR